MPIVIQSPPAGQPSTTVKLGPSTYTCAAGRAIPVPSTDADELQANGWYVAPFGTTDQRPKIGPTDQGFFVDLTLGKVLCAIRGSWVDVGLSVVLATMAALSSSGGGTGNTADHADPNNAYLAAIMGA